MTRRLPRRGHVRIFIACTLASLALLCLSTVASADATETLLSGTAVLLSTSSTSSGNGGNTSSTSSMTNIFSPASYVDYKRAGGEPTTAVDRYPFVPGPYGFGATLTGYRD